ncbi:MAG TPA: class I SAM-dependent methyltransferase [Acidimicrobiales bacterium]|nr:class I SAM-dependent methyltransferase [Acidimicrobiales bacterium]
MGVSQGERERQEMAFWTAPEGGRLAALESFTNKMSEARVVYEKLLAYDGLLAAAGTIVEIGGGQCWLSAIVAQQYPGATVIGSDIAPDALRATGEWQRVFQSRLGGAFAARSYQVPLADASVDLLVVFAAAHHFGAHRRTLAEVARVLRPGGHALYLHEPACRPYLYPLARRRVTAKRPVVAEDVLRYPEIRRLAAEAGLQCEVRFAPTTTYRGAVETVYYLMLGKAPLLCKVLPCSVDIVFTKE